MTLIMTKNKTIPVFLIIAILSLLPACKKDTSSITLATYTYSTNNRIKNLEPLSKELSQLLNKPVEIKSYADVESFLIGIKDNEVDVGLINTLGYLLLSLDNRNMQPIATLKTKKDAVDNYKTVLLTNRHDIKNLQSLESNAKSLSMMFVKKGSTSGNLVPRLLLSSIGIDSPEEQFENVRYGGDHTSTLANLLEGKTDLCAIGSNEYFKQVQSDSTLLEKTKLLWISNEIPLGPVLLNQRLSEAESKGITNLFLRLHETNTKALESIKAGWSEAKQVERFYKIDDSYYNNFRMINGNTTDLSDILNLFFN